MKSFRARVLAPRQKKTSAEGQDDRRPMEISAPLSPIEFASHTRYNGNLNAPLQREQTSNGQDGGQQRLNIPQPLPSDALFPLSTDFMQSNSSIILEGNSASSSPFQPIDSMNVPEFAPPSQPRSSDNIAISEGAHLEIDDKKSLPYELVRNLGHGASASVEMVRDVNTGSVFARKIFRNVYARNIQEAKRQFQNEIQIMRRLAAHRHIIRVFATYIAQRELALILSPIADCGDLAAFLQNFRDAGPDSRDYEAHVAILRKTFGCLASGLAFMHDRTIRHKDIKPQNILIHQGEVLYTDFGISIDHQGDSTTTGCPQSLTRRYCAPEVAEWGSRNSKSDVFSLGCVYLEILAALLSKNVPDSLLDRPFYQNLEIIQSPTWPNFHSIAVVLTRSWVFYIKTFCEWLVPVLETHRAEQEYIQKEHGTGLVTLCLVFPTSEAANEVFSEIYTTVEFDQIQESSRPKTVSENSRYLTTPFALDLLKDFAQNNGERYLPLLAKTMLQESSSARPSARRVSEMLFEPRWFCQQCERERPQLVTKQLHLNAQIQLFPRRKTSKRSASSTSQEQANSNVEVRSSSPSFAGRGLYVRAIWDYTAGGRSELDFQEGDIIQVITQLESGWWDGVLNGVRGWFPSNYTAVVPDSGWLRRDPENGPIYMATSDGAGPGELYNWLKAIREAQEEEEESE